MDKIISVNGVIPTVDGKAIKAVGGGGNVTWQQTSEAVQGFLDYVAEHPYASDDYSYTYITDFAPTTPSTENEYPIGKAINTSAGTLDVGGYRKTVSAGSNTIYNAIPNIATPYSLIAADGTVEQAGTLKPNKPLRQIKSAQARNVRDLGGWKSYNPDGTLCGTVKYGKIIRGGGVTIADRDVLVNQLGVRADLNLYCEGEQLEWTESPLGSDIKFTIAPSYNWYSLANKEAWKINMRALFDAVAHNETIYFHCMAGADRTGTFAIVVEILLGMAQSDIDAEFELTNFFTGTGTGLRTREGVKDIIDDLASYAGNSLQEKTANWLVTLGFTAEEINAFREVMIDGSPETLAPDVDTYSVTNTLAHAVSDNDAVSAVQYQPYEANITPAQGYIITDVLITMGGVDITATAWDGRITTVNRAVEKNLIGCTDNNPNTSVIDGQSYAAEVEAATGYTLEGATVSILMGGVDITEQVWMTKEDI